MCTKEELDYAILHKCIDCCGDVMAIGDCPCTGCDLHKFRTPGEGTLEQTKKAIKKHCLWCMNGQKKEVSLCPSEDCALKTLIYPPLK